MTQPFASDDEDSGSEISGWKAALVAFSALGVLIGPIVLYSLVQCSIQAATVTRPDRLDQPLTPASSPPPSPHPRNTNNLDCLVEIA